LLRNFLLNPFDLDFDVFLTQFVPKLTFNQFSKYLIEIKKKIFKHFMVIQEEISLLKFFNS